MDKRCKHLKGIKELKKQQESAKQNFKGKQNPRKGGRILEWQNHFFLKAFANPGTPGLGFGGFSVWYVP